MIYYRALASLMKDAEVEATTIILDNNNYQFKTTGSILKFDGYLKVYSDYEEKREVTSTKAIKNTVREKTVRFSSKEKQELDQESTYIFQRNLVRCQALLNKIPHQQLRKHLADIFPYKRFLQVPPYRQDYCFL